MHASRRHTGGDQNATRLANKPPPPSAHEPPPSDTLASKDLVDSMLSTKPRQTSKDRTLDVLTSNQGIRSQKSSERDTNLIRSKTNKLGLKGDASTTWVANTSVTTMGSLLEERLARECMPRLRRVRACIFGVGHGGQQVHCWIAARSSIQNVGSNTLLTHSRI